MPQHHRPAGPSMLDGAICQSCGMPFAVGAERGTEADGSPAADYCRFCYERGAFRGAFSLAEMVQVAAAGLTQATGMPVARAQALLSATLPHLARWRCRAR
jgi:Putative zinc ribbon domain